jgi:hypothetical protein
MIAAPPALSDESGFEAPPRGFHGTILGAMAVVALFSAASQARGQERIWKRFGNATGTGFGSTMDAVGDVDGDGVSDILVGVPFSDANGLDSGRVILISGADGTSITSLHGVAKEAFGFAVSRAGDVDGDGIPDFAIATFDVGGGGTYAGAVSMYSGSTLTMLWQAQGNAGEFLGSGIADVGDLDQDGIDDLVAGARFGGYARTMSGKDGSTLITVTSPDLYWGEFGYDVAAGGDVDGDGFGDFMVSDIYDSDPGPTTGAAYVFSGKAGQLLYRVYGYTDNAYMGTGMGILGDVNQDGFADFGAGAPADSSIASFGGLALVCSGKDGSVLYSYQPNSFQDTHLAIGSAFSRIGDVNLDGFDDFLVDYATSGDVYGWGTVFLNSGVDGGRLYHFEDKSKLSANQFGTRLARMGDVNGDGSPEFAATAPADSSATVNYSGSVSAWTTRRLLCDANPRMVVPNRDCTLQVGQAIASQLFAIFLTDVNGVPVFNLMALGTLDSTGRGAITGHYAGGAAGMTVGLLGLTLDAQNHLLISNVETIELQ